MERKLKMHGEPSLLRLRTHYKWSQAGFWEWIAVWFIPVQLWRMERRVRHPVQTFRGWLVWRKRPKVGEYLLYHYEGPYKVIARDGDDYTVETPDGPLEVSWMNCCDHVGTPKPVGHNET